MDKYAYIYPSEMAPLIKVKVIIKCKGQFGTANRPKGGLLNKVDTTTSDRFPSCSLLLLNGKVNFPKVKAILGHMTVSCSISKFN